MLWYQYRITVQTHREQARIAAAVNHWIETERHQGRLHASPAQALAAMPKSLLETLTRLNSPVGLKFGTDFYGQFFKVFSASDARERRDILAQMALQEVDNSHALVQIKESLDI